MSEQFGAEQFPDPSQAEVFGVAFAAWQRANANGGVPTLSQYARGMDTLPGSSFPVPAGLQPVQIGLLPPMPGSVDMLTVIDAKRPKHLKNRLRGRKNMVNRFIGSSVVVGLIAAGASLAYFRPWERSAASSEQASQVTYTTGDKELPFNPQTALTSDIITGTQNDVPPVVVGLTSEGNFEIAYVVPVSKKKNEVKYISKDASNNLLTYKYSSGLEANLALTGKGEWFKTSTKDGVTTYTIDRSKFTIQFDPNMLHGTSTVIDPNVTDNPQTPEKENEIHVNRDGTKDEWSSSSFKETDTIITDSRVSDAEKARVAKAASTKLLLMTMVTFNNLASVQLNSCKSPSEAKPADQLQKAFDQSNIDRLNAMAQRYGKKIEVKFKDGTQYVLDIPGDLKRQEATVGLDAAKVVPYKLNYDDPVTCTITFVK